MEISEKYPELIKLFETTQCSWCRKFYSLPFLCPIDRLQSNCAAFDRLGEDERKRFLEDKKWSGRMVAMIKEVHEREIIARCRDCEALNPNPREKTCWQCGKDSLRCPACGAMLRYDIEDNIWKCINTDCGKKFDFRTRKQITEPTLSQETCPECHSNLYYDTTSVLYRCKKCKRIYLEKDLITENLKQGEESQSGKWEKNKTKLMHGRSILLLIVGIGILALIIYFVFMSQASKSPEVSPSPTVTPAINSTPKVTSTPSPVPTTLPESIPKAGSRTILNGSNFEAIDSYVLNTPVSAESSVESLVSYLIKPAKNDLEKTRSIFRWITENISYDVKGYLSKNYGDLSPAGVLRNRMAVCDGYARLFERMAEIAGLDVVEISGWAKGIGYNTGDRIEGQANHAWNAVKINGGWYLLDCTWGSGHLNNALQFEQEFDEYFFLTPPEQLIYSHLPEDSKWQLLEKPVLKNQFEQFPYVKSYFFKYGLNFSSHTQSVIKAVNDIMVNISAPSDVVISSRLEQAGQILPELLTLAQRLDGQYQIEAQFPRAGEYNLVVFAKKKGDPGNYNETLRYKIEVSGGLPGQIGFPKTYGRFNEEGCYLYSPRSGYLQSGNMYIFKLLVPGAEKVAVITGDNWNYLNKSGEIFQGEVAVSKGEIQVCAKFPNSALYDCLLSYSGQ